MLEKSQVIAVNKSLQNTGEGVFSVRLQAFSMKN